MKKYTETCELSHSIESLASIMRDFLKMKGFSFFDKELATDNGDHIYEFANCERGIDGRRYHTYLIRIVLHKLDDNTTEMQMTCSPERYEGEKRKEMTVQERDVAIAWLQSFANVINVRLDGASDDEFMNTMLTEGFRQPPFTPTQSTQSNGCFNSVAIVWVVIIIILIIAVLVA